MQDDLQIYAVIGIYHFVSLSNGQSLKDATPISYIFCLTQYTLQHCLRTEMAVASANYMDLMLYFRLLELM